MIKIIDEFQECMKIFMNVNFRFNNLAELLPEFYSAIFLFSHVQIVQYMYVVSNSLHYDQLGKKM